MILSRRSFLRVAGTTGSIAFTGCNSSTVAPSIEIPASGLRDEPIPIEVTGLEPGMIVTLRSLARSLSGDEWTASATFEAGPDDTVTVGEQSPIESRYYDRADPMGLFWSMRPVGTDPTEEVPPHVLFRPPPESFEVTLTAETDGRTFAEATTTRKMYEQDITRVELPENLVGTAFLPPGDDPVPGVIHLHGQGGQPFVALAQLLASRGFAALALQYFGDPEPLPNTLMEVPVEYVDRAIDWFGNHNRVIEEGVGLFGFSRGGSLALLTASRNDVVNAVVGWASSGIVYEGLGPNQVPAGTAAWSIDGEPVPYLELAEANLGPLPTSGLPLFEPPLDTAAQAQLDRATIPVEDVDAPIYLASVTDDQRWPSTRLSERAIECLDGTGYQHSYRHRAFDGAGHFMMPPYLPTAGTMRDSTDIYGGSPAANAHANEISWNRTRSFLTTSLCDDNSGDMCVNYVPTD